MSCSIISKKRTRCSNWTRAEKTLLRELIKGQVNIIENKNTDTNTNKAKTKAWEYIFEKFNELNTAGQRESDKIKQQWKMMQMDAKKQVSSFRKAVNGTGGGPQPPDLNPDVQEILEMVPAEFEIPVHKYDSNALERTKPCTLPLASQASVTYQPPPSLPSCSQIIIPSNPQTLTYTPQIESCAAQNINLNDIPFTITEECADIPNLAIDVEEIEMEFVPKSLLGTPQGDKKRPPQRTPLSQKRKAMQDSKNTEQSATVAFKDALLTESLKQKKLLRRLMVKENKIKIDMLKEQHEWNRLEHLAKMDAIKTKERRLAELHNWRRLQFKSNINPSSDVDESDDSESKK